VEVDAVRGLVIESGHFSVPFSYLWLFILSSFFILPCCSSQFKIIILNYEMQEFEASSVMANFVLKPSQPFTKEYGKQPPTIPNQWRSKGMVIVCKA
jgi:hypothetical protein